RGITLERSLEIRSREMNARGHFHGLRVQAQHQIRDTFDGRLHRRNLLFIAATRVHERLAWCDQYEVALAFALLKNPVVDQSAERSFDRWAEGPVATRLELPSRGKPRSGRKIGELLKPRVPDRP